MVYVQITNVEPYEQEEEEEEKNKKEMDGGKMSEKNKAKASSKEKSEDDDGDDDEPLENPLDVTLECEKETEKLIAAPPKPKKSEFEKNYGVNQFFFATPFVMEDGAAGAGVEKRAGATQDTFLRKTILTTEKTFPYLLRRIPIVNKREIVLLPIQKGIEDIKRKSREIEEQLKAKTPDRTMLQLVLQVRIKQCLSFNTLPASRELGGVCAYQ